MSRREETAPKGARSLVPTAWEANRARVVPCTLIPQTWPQESGIRVRGWVRIVREVVEPCQAMVWAADRASTDPCFCSSSSLPILLKSQDPHVAHRAGFVQRGPSLAGSCGPRLHRYRRRLRQQTRVPFEGSTRSVVRPRQSPRGALARQTPGLVHHPDVSGPA